MRFLVLGCNGMAGHLISLYLKEQGHFVEGVARKKSKYIKNVVGDVTDFEKLKRVVFNHNYDSVINCVGILNQFAEQKPSEAILLNSYLPHFLADITKNTGIQIIQMSTDCVFSGRRGKYTEDDVTDGVTYYDRTKAMGELDDKKNITLRNSIIGPDINENGIGFMNWFLKQKGSVLGYTQAIWTGQTTLQLAKTMEYAANNRCYGLYNAVPKSSISKYQLLVLINNTIRGNRIEVIPSDAVKVDKSLVRTRKGNLDYTIPEYDVMINELSEWMIEHKELYPQYDLKRRA